MVEAIAARAGVHAALAEPHRLKIADALALGDLSPGALASRLGLSTNLLAHHLAVLESAGVVHRKRSEGDGRRAYLTLAWDNPVVAASVGRASAPGVRRIVFVCTANSARSQFAASAMSSLTDGDIDVTSGGTLPAREIHPFALAELGHRGLAPVTPTPTSVFDVLRADDFVVAVCDNATEQLGEEHVALHWSVRDPTGGGQDDFTRAFDELLPRIDRLRAAITRESSTS